MAVRDRSLRVTIDADSAKLEAAMARSRNSVERFGRSTANQDRQLRRADTAVDRYRESLSDLQLTLMRVERELDEDMARALERQHDAMERVGRGMMTAGAAIGVGLGLAVREAVKWESAWAGVVKTVDGSPEQMAALEEELRELATTLPATHEEIAGVAEAAGQLGIKREDIASFTKVMVDMGVATNLTADEAATSMARFSNIMGTSASDVDKLGSAVVALGNDGASTEAEILDMGLRIAAAGTQMGMTEGEVLGMANAMSSLGIRAEAGGTAISQVMFTIDAAVDEGGGALTQFAELSGMSAQEFTQAWQEDPARALVSVVAGLDQVQQSGGSVNQTLEGLEISGIRQVDTMGRLAGGHQLLADSLDLGNQSWSDNTALLEEAARRYETTESRMKIAKNQVVDLGIEMGETLLPALGAVADGASLFVGFMSDLPGPVKTAATIFAGLAAAVGLVGGAALIAGPKIAAMQASLVNLPPVARGAGRALSGALSVLGGPWGLAIGAGITALGFFAVKHQETKRAIEAHTAALDQQTGALTDANREMVANELVSSGAADAAERLGISQKDLLDAALGVPEAMERVNGRLREQRSLYGDDLPNAMGASENSSNRLKGEAKQVSDVIGGQNKIIAKSKDELKLLKKMGLDPTAEAATETEEAMAGLGEEAEVVDPRLERLAGRFGLLSDEAEDAGDAAQKMLDEWSKGIAGFVDLMGAYETVLERKKKKEQDAAQATADSTDDASDSWEDFLGDTRVTAKEYIKELEKMVQDQEDWSDNMIRLAGRIPPAMFDELMRLGPEGAPLVAMLVNSGNKELDRISDLWPKTTAQGMDQVVNRVADAEPVLARIAQDEGETVANKIRQGMIRRKETVYEAARRLGVRIDDGIGDDRTVRVRPAQHKDFRSNLRYMGGELDGLARNRTATINFEAQADFNAARIALNYGGRARGGPVWPGQKFWVGEEGPELVEFPQNGKVHDHKASMHLYDEHRKAMGGRDLPYDLRVRPSRGIDNVPHGQANDFALAMARVFGEQASKAIQSSAAASTSSGRVLPAGSYSIGGGTAAHGYPALDLPAPTGTPIYAVAAGVVSRALRLGYSYGIHAYINHAGGRQSRYAHMSAMYVSAGQRVNRGQNIGRVGSTGNSSGPHLHYEDFINGVGRPPENLGIFDRGGRWPHGTLGVNTSGGMETVLNRDQSRQFDRLIDTLGRPSAPPVVGGGAFVGDLYLDSGEFLGAVRGEVRQGISEHDRRLKRTVGQRSGVAR